MNKRKYILTPNSYGFKIEVWDEYGNWNSVYEKTIESASKYVVDWWDNSEEREESNKIRDKAIRECIKIDRESGITSRTRDCLD